MAKVASAKSNGKAPHTVAGVDERGARAPQAHNRGSRSAGCEMTSHSDPTDVELRAVERELRGVDEDVAAEAWVEIWEKRRAGEHIENLAALARTIAERRKIDRIRNDSSWERAKQLTPRSSGFGSFKKLEAAVRAQAKREAEAWPEAWRFAVERHARIEETGGRERKTAKQRYRRAKASGDLHEIVHYIFHGPPSPRRRRLVEALASVSPELGVDLRDEPPTARDLGIAAILAGEWPREFEQKDDDDDDEKWSNATVSNVIDAMIEDMRRTYNDRNPEHMRPLRRSQRAIKTR